MAPPGAHAAEPVGVFAMSWKAPKTVGSVNLRLLIVSYGRVLEQRPPVWAFVRCRS
jgi:hypothetical protein